MPDQDGNLILADANAPLAGYEREALARLEVLGTTRFTGGTDRFILYADADRGGTSVVHEGELGLSTTQTLISRIEYESDTASQQRFGLNDNDNPELLSLAEYLGPDGSGNDLFVFLQTSPTEFEFLPVSDNFGTDIGGNYIQLKTAAYDDFAALQNSLDTAGQRYNFGLVRALPSTRIAGIGSTVAGGASGLDVESPATVTGSTIISTPGFDEAATPAGPDTYGFGEHIEIEVVFSIPVDVTGTPTYPINLGQSPSGSPEQADYNRGGGTDTLVFRWTVAATDSDTNGVFFYRNRSEANIQLPAGATIRNVGTDIDADVELDASGVVSGTLSGHRVDGSLTPGIRIAGIGNTLAGGSSGLAIESAVASVRIAGVGSTVASGSSGLGLLPGVRIAGIGSTVAGGASGLGLLPGVRIAGIGSTVAGGASALHVEEVPRNEATVNLGVPVYYDDEVLQYTDALNLPVPGTLMAAGFAGRVQTLAFGSGGAGFLSVDSTNAQASDDLASAVETNPDAFTLSAAHGAITISGPALGSPGDQTEAYSWGLPGDEWTAFLAWLADYAGGDIMFTVRDGPDVDPTRIAGIGSTVASGTSFLGRVAPVRISGIGSTVASGASELGSVAGVRISGIGLTVARGSAALDTVAGVRVSGVGNTIAAGLSALTREIVASVRISGIGVTVSSGSSSLGVVEPVDTHIAGIGVTVASGSTRLRVSGLLDVLSGTFVGRPTFDAVPDTDKWPFSTQWSEIFEESHQFRTEIIRSHNGREQRIAQRTRPRLSYTFTNVPRDVGEYLRRVSTLPGHKYYIVHPRDHVTITGNVPENSFVAEVSEAEPWIVEDAYLYFEGESGSFFCTQVTRATGQEIEIDPVLPADINEGMRVFRAAPARLAGDASLRALTTRAGTARMDFIGDPVDGYRWTPGQAPAMLDGLEYLVKEPNWAAPPQTRIEQEWVELDKGRGIINRRFPDPHVTRSLRVRHLVRDDDDLNAVLGLFYRARGRQKKFRAPTWMDEFRPDGDLRSADVMFTVPGAGLARSWSSGPPDWLRIYAGSEETLLPVSAVAVSGENSRVTLGDPVGRDIALASIDMVSWVPTVRFETDLMKVQWHTDGVAEITMDYRTVPDA